MDPVPPAPHAPPPRGEALTDQEIETFAGYSGGYYRLAWQLAKQTGGLYAGFNWPAALLNHVWMLYRRMYLECAVTVVVLTVLLLVEQWIHRAVGLPLPGGGMLFLLGSIPVIGLLGNLLYLRRARAAVQQSRLEPDPQRGKERLASRGGTSNLALVLGILANVAFAVISMMTRR
ncbi:MAG TPA: DUF2628 domain-containing protein [Gemmatimonadales bacterium]|nr:DUF2628 domain-containing protein [Gemmatimonadales bacterium]